MLKSVLSSIPVISLAVIKVPLMVIHHIEAHLANYLWDNVGEHRAHWISWKSICRRLLSEGGLGVRSLQEVMEALHAKLAWSVLKGTSLWAHYARSKYLGQHGFVTTTVASHVWKAVMGQLH